MAMKLDRLHEYIVPVVVVLCGMVFAVLAGNMTAKGQMGSLAAVFGAAVAVTTLLVLRARVWILMPVLWPLTGQVQALPLPFSVRHLAVFTVAAAFVGLTAFKIIRLKPVYRFIDVLLLVVVLYLVTVYLRNPVGVEALGTARVGGRPYLEVAVAVLAYLILVRSHLTAAQSQVLPIVMIASRGFEFILNVVADRFPAAAPYMAEIYSGVNLESFNASMQMSPGGEGTRRQEYMASMGAGLALLTAARWPPITLLNPLNFGRWLLFCAGVILALLSGFRSILVWSIAVFMLSSYLQRGKADVLRLASATVVLLTIVIMFQGTLFDLPFAAQRALSFLPGKWDPIATADAQHSTKWRTDMWKEMLTSDRYIQSKWFGDGFGYTQYQLATIRSNTQNVGVMAQQENFMIQGAVHSGPVSAVRFVGYLGLTLFLLLQVIVVRWAWQLVRRAQSTQFSFLSLFIGLAAIWEPFNFVFIFGAYEHALPEVIFTCGMLKMLENSINESDRQRIPSTEETSRPTSGSEAAGLTTRTA
jgi:hypothetical protein